MKHCIKYSPRASLIISALRMQQLKIWEMVQGEVDIQQKVIVYQPSDKLKDAFINIMAGGQGLTEVNSRVRCDSALSRAFGREDCAEQSTISDTLNACTGVNVAQMRVALRRIYQRHGQGYAHPYGREWQLLDADMSGMPAGCQGEGVEKGYFAQ